MATVQQYGAPKVQAQATPLIGRAPINIQPDRSGEIVGNALIQAGDELSRQREQIDQLRVEETLNKLRERQLDMTFSENGGYLNVQGKNALPQNGQTLSDRYVGQFDSYAKELEQGLGNENQKRLFKQYAARTGLEFRSGLMRHEMQQVDNWRNQTIDGVFAVEADNAAKNWNNPESIGLSRARIDINIAKKREAEGLPADQVDKVRLGALSRMHDGVINAALTNGAVDYASEYIEKNKSEIDADTLLKTKAAITKVADNKYALGKATSIISSVNQAINPTGMDRLTNLVMGQESGGKRYGADGKLLESPKGAKGEMQVLDGTNKDPGYGVKPAQDDSPDERARVGRDYLKAMIQLRGGDISKALASYNAGPGAVDKAIKEAERQNYDNVQRGRAADPSLWLKLLPAETQNYVSSIGARYASGQGAAQKPTFADLDAQLKADPRLMSRPGAYEKAREYTKQQFDELTQADKQRREEAVGDVYRELLANGGNFAALPYQLTSVVDPEKIPGIMKTAAEIKRGVPTVTNPALYQKLTTDPTYLKGMSEGQLYALRGELSQSDHQHFVNEWAKLNGRTTASAENAGNVNTSALTQTLNQRLSTMGIDPTPKDGSSDAVRVGAIRQFVTRSILAEQAQSGKKMDDAQTTKFVDGLFANSVELKSFFGGKRNVSALSMTPGDVPSDARDKIKQAFKAAGAPDPSDADILQIYWQQRFANNGKSALAKAKPPQQEQQKGTGSTSGW